MDRQKTTGNTKSLESRQEFDRPPSIHDDVDDDRRRWRQRMMYGTGRAGQRQQQFDHWLLRRPAGGQQAFSDRRLSRVI